MMSAGIGMLKIYFFGFVFMALQFAGQSTFQAVGDAKHAIFFSLLRKAFIVVPLTILLPMVGLGVKGVFLAEPISNVIGGTACFITMLMTVYKKLKKGIEKDAGYETASEAAEQAVNRIQQMEGYLDELTEVMQDSLNRLLQDIDMQKKLKILTDYYENGQWLKDFERDEKGELPKDLKRGVLSEDAVYNLLFEIEQYRNTSEIPPD